MNSESNDKQMKKKLVVDTIATICASSPHDILQNVNHALTLSNDGSKLEAAILSGGYTNYSYKVFVDKHPELCVFAKLSFEFALWNPDKSAHYDLKRTDNEWEIMRTFANLKPDYVASPLGIWDLEQEGQKMKLLVTEWSKGDEQFSNQFIDGSVDPRIAPKIADALAELHSIKGFDPDFNAMVKPCMENLLEKVRKGVLEACDVANPKNRTEVYMAALGKDILMKVINKSIADFHRRDCLVHSDTHVFNILVEAKPSIQELELFGPNGSVVLCDWEMAYAGPIGKDIGLTLAFPIGCMVAHALNGHLESNESIDGFIDALLENYSSKMMDAGKNSDEMAAIHRNIIGWCGWFTFIALYFNGCFIDTFPAESKESLDHLRDAMGVLGLKMMRLSYDTDYVAASTESEQVKMLFKCLWQEEVAYAFSKFVAGKRRLRPRKSSLLRATNRRLSDSVMNFFDADNLAKLCNGEDYVDNEPAQ